MLVCIRVSRKELCRIWEGRLGHCMPMHLLRCCFVSDNLCQLLQAECELKGEKQRQSYLGVVVVWGECKHSNEEEQQQLQRGGNPIVQEVGYPPEDAPRDDYSVHDRAQPRLCQHYVSRCPGLHSEAPYK